ncbi:MAG: YicC/YloC family endoribonuclease [Candidatus Borkfalkiaceae bacterium]|nr:YicC/YloC family endoribonuclease [Christensenellaceae bacterium]
MRSMTGYGKAVYEENGITLTVELKTVNNRFLDLVPKYPRAFVPLDECIRKAVSAGIRRGRTELFITYSDVSESGKTLVVDERLAGDYVSAAKRLSEKFAIPNDMTVTSLMRCPDVVTETVADGEEEKLAEIVRETIVRAVGSLNAMRDAEGKKLKADLLSRADTVEELAEKIRERAPEIKEEYRRKLEERMKEILSDVRFDEGRLLQEVAVYADKTNIDEELTRLKSHVFQLRRICEEETDAGKKLDFLMQEFNRETNTICSKSNDIGITKLALALKNEIEKMREQVQNIE